VLRSRAVRLTLVLAALVNGATFATFAYLAVIATEVTRLPDGAVPGLLAAFGVGAFLGVNVAGRSGDGRLRRGLVLVLCALPAGWLALAVASPHAVALFLVSAVLGALSFGAGSALVGRVMHVASDAPALNGAFATVALNVGAFVGPLLAGAVTGSTGDAQGAPWVSAGLATAALVVLAAARLRGAPEPAPLAPGERPRTSRDVSGAT
jgi:DHA1 family chloramphenicol resistance protein-like MFS transporter